MRAYYKPARISTFFFIYVFGERDGHYIIAIDAFMV
jgi:hypothetical protein